MGSPRVVALLAMALLLWGLPGVPVLAQEGVSAGEASVVGEVVNGTEEGAPLAGIAVVLHRHGPAGEVLDLEAVTDEEGQFSFADVALLEGFVYGVSVEYLGVVYGQDLELLDGETVPATLTVFEVTSDKGLLRAATVSTLITGVDEENRYVRVLEMVAINNSGNRAFAPADAMDVLRFSLPEAAVGLEVDTDLPEPDVVVVDRGFGLTSPVPPGTSSIWFAYWLPYSGSSVSFSRVLLYGADQLRVLVPQEDMGVDSPQATSREAVSVGGAPYMLLSAQSLAPGAEVEVTLTGLPVPSLGTRLAQPILGIPAQYLAPGIVGVVALVVVGYALLRARSRSHLREEEGEESPLRDARREVVEELADLEERFAQGDVEAQDYHEERSRLARRLAALGRAGEAEAP